MSKKKSKAEVLIIIPTLNNLDLLKGVLSTIRLSQPYYLLLIDNGSTDGSRDFIKEYAKNFGVFAFLSKVNLGVAGSWNFGIEFGIESLGCKSFIILNNDILLLPKTLDVMLEGLKDPMVGMCTAFNFSGRVASADDFLKLKIPAKGVKKETPDFSCFAISKNCIDKVGLFDEAFYPAYFEDNDYHYRMRLEHLKAICDSRAIYYHLGSRSRNLTPAFRQFLDECYLRNKEYFKQKWGGEPGDEKFTEPFNGKGPETIEIPEIAFSDKE